MRRADLEARSSKMTPRSARQYLHNIGLAYRALGLPDDFEWSTLTPSMVDGLVPRLRDLRNERTGEPYADGTIGATCSVVRGWVRHLCDVGDISPAIERSVLKRVRLGHAPRAKGETVAPPSQSELMRAAAMLGGQGDDMSIRDAAIMALLMCGAGRINVVEASHSDYVPAQVGELAMLRLPSTKGRRYVCVDPAMPVLSVWLRTRGHHPGPLFHAYTRHRNVRGTLTPMTSGGLYAVVRRTWREAIGRHVNSAALKVAGPDAAKLFSDTAAEAFKKTPRVIKIDDAARRAVS